MTDPRELVAELKTLKAFLTKEATDYINFLNSQQMKRTLDYKARGDSTADYRGLSGIEETKYWPFIRIADSAASLIEQQLEGREERARLISALIKAREDAITARNAALEEAAKRPAPISCRGWDGSEVERVKSVGRANPLSPTPEVSVMFPASVQFL